LIEEIVLNEEERIKVMARKKRNRDKKND